MPREVVIFDGLDPAELGWDQPCPSRSRATFARVFHAQAASRFAPWNASFSPRSLAGGIRLRMRGAASIRPDRDTWIFRTCQLARCLDAAGDSLSGHRPCRRLASIVRIPAWCLPVTVMTHDLLRRRFSGTSFWRAGAKPCPCRHRLRKPECAVIRRRRQHRRPGGHRFRSPIATGCSWSRPQAP
jgi:hypothetical protein